MKIVKSIGYFLLALIVAATFCADFIIMGLFGDIDIADNGLSTGIAIALIVMVSGFAAVGKIVISAFLLVKIVLIAKKQGNK